MTWRICSRHWAGGCLVDWLESGRIVGVGQLVRIRALSKKEGLAGDRSCQFHSIGEVHSTALVRSISAAVP